MFRGTLDYDDDIDFFRFQAEAGQSYQIDVARGTLYDPKLDLFDSDGSFLDTNDDYGEYLCLAPLLESSQFRRALRCGEGRHRDLHADHLPLHHC